jgi:hypothetical protein
VFVHQEIKSKRVATAKAETTKVDVKSVALQTDSEVRKDKPQVSSYFFWTYQFQIQTRRSNSKPLK